MRNACSIGVAETGNGRSRTQSLRSWGVQGGAILPLRMVPLVGCAADLGTATREMGGKAGYAENMSRAAAVNAQRERVLLFSLSSFCDPFQAAWL